ncbi:MAG TPA: TonB-dependent receptor [Polyangiaceae bacterium]
MALRKITKIAAGLAFGTVLLASGSALADERSEARSHFKKGMADIADGRYDAGIDELKKAYDILPHPNVLYNIARAYVDEGDLENAVAYYKKYLEGNPKDSAEVSQIVTSLEARIRKQQAQLIEAQQAQTPTGPTPGGPAGPGAGTQPGPGGVTPGGPTPGGVAGGPKPPGGGVAGGAEGNVPAAALKTGDEYEETVVTASKVAQSPLDAPNSTSIITEQDIRLSGITHIPDLLQRLAGVDTMVTTGGQTEVSLRGFNQRLSNKVLVLVNGRSVFVDLLGATIWSTLSIGVEDIERIEVVRGPGSALYGADAFNGVINIITKQPGEGGSGFNVGYGSDNTTHGTAWAAGREKETAYRFSVGYDYLPRWSREVGDGRRDLTLGTGNQNVSSETVRMDGTVTRQLGKDVTAGIQGGYTSGADEILGVGPVNDILLNPFYASDVTAFLNAKHFEVRTFYNRIEGHNILNAGTIGQSLLPGSFNLNVYDAEAQYIDQFETGKGVNHDLHVGLNYRYKYVEWTFQEGAVAENHAGFFVHDEVKIGKPFALVGDYRADYDPYLDRIIQSPRVSVLVHPSQQSTIRGIIGTAFRTPTFLEAYLGFPIQLPVTGGSQLAVGNRPDQPGFKLNPEQVITYELGYMNNESDLFNFDTAFFYNHVNNLIDITPTRPITVGDLANPNVPTAPDGQSGLYPLFLGGFENQCQVFNVYGAEIGARLLSPIEGLDFYANTTLMDVRQDNSGCTPFQQSLLVADSRTPALAVNGGAQLRTKFGLDASLDGHYESGADWAEQVVDIQRQQIHYASFHLDPYAIVNLSVGYRFLKNKNAEIRGVGFNLFDDEHREHPFGQVVGRRFMGLFTYKF